MGGKRFLFLHTLLILLPFGVGIGRSHFTIMISKYSLFEEPQLLESWKAATIFQRAWEGEIKDLLLLLLKYPILRRHGFPRAVTFREKLFSR